MLSLVVVNTIVSTYTSLQLDKDFPLRARRNIDSPALSRYLSHSLSLSLSLSILSRLIEHSEHNAQVLHTHTNSACSLPPLLSTRNAHSESGVSLISCGMCPTTDVISTSHTCLYSVDSNKECSYCRRSYCSTSQQRILKRAPLSTDIQ